MQVGELNVKLGLDMSAYQQGLENAKNSTQSLGNTLRNVFQNAAGFALGIAGFQGVKAAIQDTIGAGISFDSQMQQARISFETMLGSAQKAQTLLGQLQQFAAQTPFEFPDLQDAAKRMLAFGFSADQIMPMLKSVGDAAAGLGMSGKEGIDRVVIALGQMQAKAKVSSDEMLQLTEAGIPAWDILAKSMGKSTAEVMKMSEKGLIPADKAIQALVAGMEERFPSMMDKQAKSFAGLKSTLVDNLNIIFGDLMRPAFDWLCNAALPRAIELTNNFTNALKAGGAVEAFKTIIPPGVVDAAIAAGNAIKDLFNFISTNGETVRALLVGIGAGFAVFRGYQAIQQTIMAIQGLRVAMMALTATNPVLLAVSVAIGAIAMAGYTVYTNWDQIKTFLVNTWNGIMTAATTTWTAITTFFSGIWTGVVTDITTTWNGIVAFLQGVWNSIAGIFANVWNTIGPVVMAGWDNLRTFFQSLFDTIRTIFEAGWEAIKAVFATAFLAIYYLITGQWGKIGEVFDDFATRINHIISDAWASIQAIWVRAFEVIKSNTSVAWNYITGLFSSAWGSITGAVANGWNAVKQWFANASASVKNTVSSMWNSVVSFFASAPGRIMGALAGLRNALLGVWENLKNDAINAGRNLLSGFVQGIRERFSNAVAAAQNLGRSVIEAAKRELDEHSPSKVFVQIGQFISQGLAQGIQSTGGQAVNATVDVITAITTAVETSAARVKAAEDELAAAQKRLADIQRQQAEEKDRQDRAAMQQDIDNAAQRVELARQDLALLQQKRDAMVAQGKDVTGINQQIAKSEQSLTELQQKAADARTKLAEFETQKQVDAAKERVDALKQEQDTLEKERDLLDQMQAAWRNYTDGIKKAADDYQAKVEEVNKKLEEDIQKATDAYQTELDRRAKSLRDFVGLFDAVQPKNVTGDQLLENLRGQVATFEQWQENLKALTARGVDEGMIAELRDMGPKAAAEIAALNTLSDQQLNEYVALWRQKNEDARQEATSQLTGLAADTQAKIAELRSNAAVQLEQYRQEWRQKNEEIRQNTVDTLQKIVDEASKQGTAMVTALVSAIATAMPQLSTALAGLPGLTQAGGNDQIAQAQQQKTGVVGAAVEQQQGVNNANLQTVTSVLQMWTDAGMQMAVKQNEIKTNTVTTWQQIQQQLAALWLKMLADLQKTWNDMRKYLFDVTKQVEDKFTYLVNAANSWGIDLMSNFIAGIWSQFDRLQETLQTMAEIVDAYMPHSPAKRGPLSRLNEWGPALVRGLAQGIQSNLPSLENVTSRMAALSPGVLAPAMATSNAYYGGNTIYVQITGANNASDMADQLIRELARRGVRL